MKVLELTFFGVTPAGVIVLPDIPQPQIRSDVFELIDPRTIHSCQELIDLIESCQPLQEHFQILGQAHLQEHGHVAPSVESVLACRDAVNSSQRLILGALRRDPDTGWRQWIQYSGDAALQGFLDQVHEWLDDDIDWSESDHFDVVWNGQLAALSQSLSGILCLRHSMLKQEHLCQARRNRQQPWRRCLRSPKSSLSN